MKMYAAVSVPDIFRLSLAITSLWMADCCMKTIFSHAIHDPAEVIASFPMLPGDGGACGCCGLCHQNRTCASLSFSAASGKCLLYRSVASYATITQDFDWTYFVMPNRSQHHQFCRQASDCQVESDFCRASVCTELETVTCKVIYEVFGARKRFGDFVPKMHGWLNGQHLALTCSMREGRGYTRLLYSRAESPFTHDNILSFNERLDDPSGPHSILDLADDILQSSSEPRYRLRVYAPHASERKALEIEVPHAEPVLASSPRPVGGVVLVNELGVETPRLLWSSTDGAVLASVADPKTPDMINVDVAGGLVGVSIPGLAPSNMWVNGEIARTDGFIYVDDDAIKWAAVFICE